MTERALWNAMAERERLIAKIRHTEEALTSQRTALKDTEEWIAKYHVFADAPDLDAGAEEHSENIASTDVLDTADEKPVAERKRTTGNPKKEIVAAAAREIIEEAGQPVSRADLFKELAAREVVIEGKDPEQVLSTMMWRTREEYRLVRLSTGGYWLAERPHEESGYDPTQPRSDMDQILSTPADEIGGDEPEPALPMLAASARHAALSAEIAEADRLYGINGMPELMDDKYEEAWRELKAIEVRFPGLAGKGKGRGADVPEDASAVSEPDPDLARDAQFDRETDEAAVTLENERKKDADIRSQASRSDDSLPPVRQRIRPIHEQQAHENPFAAFLSGGMPLRKT